MPVTPNESIRQNETLPEEIVDTILAEPGLAWFAAQALWIAQPALEAFWPAEKIASLADRFEAALDSRGAGSAPAAEDLPKR